MDSRNDYAPKRRLALKALGGSALADGLVECLSAATLNRFALRAIESEVEVPIGGSYKLNYVQRGEMTGITIKDDQALAAFTDVKSCNITTEIE